MNEEIALVAFVEPMEDGELRMLPELAHLSRRLSLLPLTVVQITMAAGECQDVVGWDDAIPAEPRRAGEMGPNHSIVEKARLDPDSDLARPD